ncbi:proton-conducting membrane transporter [Acetobacteraceae bacterium]|nr:proton-conducting membrane transporter [Acetobacteraceae bacterium]
MITGIFADPLSLLTVVLLGFAACAIVGGLLSSFKPMRPVVALGTLLFSAIGVLSASEMLFAPKLFATLPHLHFQIEVSGLHAFFLLVVMLSGIWAAIYNIGALGNKETGVSAWEAFFGNMLLAALSATVLSSDALSFLVGLEISALSAYFLTVRNEGDKAEKAGQNILLLTQFGIALLGVAFLILNAHVHSLQFDAIRAAHLSEHVRTEIFLLALFGLGVFSGMFPLHGWAPQSHSSASPASAMLFSSSLMKAGLFGILLFGLDLLGVPPLWWGVLVLLLGAVTAFFGGLYALQEHDLRRLLSYHSLESSGIILLGIGAAMAGISLQLPLLLAFGIIGALFQIFNHSLFGAALLLGAGTVEERTGLKDIEKMGGLARKMPVTAIAILIALGAMSALPPLNGFVSEWMVYQGLFHFSAAPSFVAHLFGPLIAVVLAVTGALAVMCASKVFGVAFLGAARSDAAEHVAAGGCFQTLSAFIPALLCIVFGLVSPWVIPTIARIAGLPVQEHGIGSALVSAPLLTILLLALPILPLLLAALYQGHRPPRRVSGTAWSCGYDYDKAMNINATSIAQPLRVMFAPFYAVRHAFPQPLKNHFHGKTFVAACRGIAAVGLAALLIIAIAFA